jgi:hypothetical protein
MSTPNVFISYSHSDSEWVREFAEALRNQNINVWFDEWQVMVGDSLPEALEKGMRESDAIVVVVSSSNARNPNVLFELGSALGMRKRLIPVLSEDLETSSIPYGLRSRRYLTKRMPGETAREVASVLKTVKAG